MKRDDTKSLRLGNLGFGSRLASISCVSKLLSLFSPQCLYLKKKELGLDSL